MMYVNYDMMYEWCIMKDSKSKSDLPIKRHYYSQLIQLHVWYSEICLCIYRGKQYKSKTRSLNDILSRFIFSTFSLLAVQETWMWHGRSNRWDWMYRRWRGRWSRRSRRRWGCGDRSKPRGSRPSPSVASSVSGASLRPAGISRVDIAAGHPAEAPWGTSPLWCHMPVAEGPSRCPIYTHQWWCSTSVR